MIVNKPKVYVPLEDSLRTMFLHPKWNNIFLASAFLTNAGADFLIELFDQFNSINPVDITILVGVKKIFTEPTAIRKLIDYINKYNNDSISIKLLVPRDLEFHVKCYVFQGEASSSMIIGSANLTGTGLMSQGEMSVEITDSATINEAVNYLTEYFINESRTWSSIICSYDIKYEEVHSGSFTDIEPYTFPFVLKRIKFRSPRLHPVTQGLPDKSSLRRESSIVTGATINSLQKLSKDLDVELKEIRKTLKETKNPISNTHSFLYMNYEKLDEAELYELYPIGGYFDNAYSVMDDDSDWKINSRRVICKVGMTQLTRDGHLAVFLPDKRIDKNAYYEYTVTEEILSEAKRLGIMYNYSAKPSSKEMLEFITFVKERTS